MPRRPLPMTQGLPACAPPLMPRQRQKNPAYRMHAVTLRVTLNKPELSFSIEKSSSY
jgi:hypothetical protein